MPERQPIVIAESNFLTARLIAASLQGAGHPIAIGRDGDQAMRLVDAHGASVMILDLNLSRPSGLEFLRNLRQQKPGVRVLAMSSPIQSELRAAAYSLGVFDFVGLPFLPEQLVEQVEGMLP